MTTPLDWIEEAQLRTQDARILQERGRYARAISALYYAVHAACKGALLTRDYEVRRHGGIVRGLGRYFIVPGLLSNDTAGHINALRQRREAADYQLEPFTEEDAETWRTWTADLIDTLQQQI